MWLKVAGAALVILSSSCLGAGAAARMGERLRELKRIRVMIIHLKGEILYANVPLADGFERTGKRERSRAGALFLKTAERLREGIGESFFEIWEQECRAFLAGSVLNQREGEQLTAFGEHLGYLDRDMQERTLLLYLEELEQEIRALEQEISQKSRLYRSIGVMAGLFLAVALI